eukprot:CAMPEP_0185762936 /NCGR_PEP_ID=MMETSP1174-20130828/21904_1 /TAXON_ID=35687 /ORGANISM="Dictyocha speculum, Strain CCMP1381" /LENGTH=32 /DNA_ID= /DNA_START= /DNA_END= /DNA_ORIENTATION=
MISALIGPLSKADDLAPPQYHAQSRLSGGAWP